MTEKTRKEIEQFANSERVYYEWFDNDNAVDLEFVREIHGATFTRLSQFCSTWNTQYRVIPCNGSITVRVAPRRFFLKH